MLREHLATLKRRLADTTRTSGSLWTATIVLDRAGFGALRLWPVRTFALAAVEAQTAAILRQWGMSEEHVAITVRHMTYADLCAIESHGCAMLRAYHRDLVAGKLNIRPVVSPVRQSATTAVLDGGGGLGHVAADAAMQLAIEKCRQAGIGAVAVRNSGHFGAAGAYASLAAESGLIGLAMTTTAAPSVVPTFAAESKLGTNPIAFAAPALKNKPFLLDMATSTVPLGRLVSAWRKGRPVPAGWAMDPRGRPETNARLAVKYRRLTPLGGGNETGGHKGYGLAMMVEILASVLPACTEGSAGHFFLALDPGQFGDAGAFATKLDSRIDGLRAARRADPHQPVMVAGDPEHEAAARRRRAGIPLPRKTVEDLRMVSKLSGAPFLLD